MITTVIATPQANFNYDSFGRYDTIKATCYSNETSYRVAKLYLNDVIIAENTYYDVNYTINFTIGNSTGHDFNSSNPLYLALDQDSDTYSMLEDTSGCREATIYANYTLSAFEYPSKLSVTISGDSGGAVGSIFSYMKNGDWSADTFGEGYIAKSKYNLTVNGNTTSILQLKVPTTSYNSPCLTTGFESEKHYIYEALIFNGSSTNAELLYTNNAGNLTIDDVYRLECNEFLSGTWYYSTKENKVVNAASVLKQPKLSEVGQIFAGGGSIGEVLEKWNPFYYEKLTTHIPMIGKAKTVENLLIYIRDLFRFTLGYILREPATLVPIDLQLPRNEEFYQS